MPSGGAQRPTEPGLDERRQAYVIGLGARVIVAGAFAVALFAIGVVGYLPAPQIHPPVAILAVLALVNLPYWLIGKRRGFPLSQFAVHWVVDILLLTIFVALVGGYSAPYAGMSTAVLSLFAGLQRSRRMALCLASLSLGLFVVVASLEGSGAFRPADGLWSHHYGPGAAFLAVFAPIVFTLGLAWMGGSIGDELRRARTTLEMRVAERTAELNHAQEEIEDLVRIITHDLKNVSVAAIETARKLVERESTGLSPRGQKYATRLLEDMRGMHRMLNEALALFRESDPVKSARVWVDVEPIVRRSFEYRRSAIETRGIEVAIGPLPRAFAEPAKIHHVFENLIDNACRFVCEAQSPRIEVWGERRGDRVIYRVRDNGIGIDEYQHTRIFELYHRGVGSAVNGGGRGGHGVGLAIVKRIVERAGGTIGVESRPGCGATFAVTLPLEERVAA